MKKSKCSSPPLRVPRLIPSSCWTSHLLLGMQDHRMRFSPLPQLWRYLSISFSIKRLTFHSDVNKIQLTDRLCCTNIFEGLGLAHCILYTYILYTYIVYSMHVATKVWFPQDTQGCPFIPLSLCPSVPLSLYPSVPLSLYPSVPLSLCPSIPLSLFPSVPLSLYPLYMDEQEYVEKGGLLHYRISINHDIGYLLNDSV